jgi:hypothetical protein
MKTKRWMWWQEYTARGRVVREYEADVDAAGLALLERSFDSGHAIEGYVRSKSAKWPFTHETVPQVLRALREAELVRC